MINDYIQYIVSNTEMVPQNILEIGSRDGLDANAVKNMFAIPDDRVYLVEPYQYHIDAIKATFPQYRLFECGIGSRKGKFNFYGIKTADKNYSGMSSFLERNDTIYQQFQHQGNLEVLEVEAITGSDLLDQINEDVIDLCDLDVEGMTYDVLMSFGDKINKIKTLHFECEEEQLWKYQLLYPIIRNYLESRNFVEVFKKPVYHKQLDLIYINKSY